MHAVVAEVRFVSSSLREPIQTSFHLSLSLVTFRRWTSIQLPSHGLHISECELVPGVRTDFHVLLQQSLSQVVDITRNKNGVFVQFETLFIDLRVN